jgi:hypothetical protein
MRRFKHNSVSLTLSGTANKADTGRSEKVELLQKLESVKDDLDERQTAAT